MIVSERKQSRDEHRCAVCRDGPNGLVRCHGCDTVIHASCLIDVGGCPTLGCGEKDPLAKAPRETEGSSVVQVVGDGNVVSVGGWSKANADGFVETKCSHDWNPANQQCFNCGITVEKMACQEFGSIRHGKRVHNAESRAVRQELHDYLKRDIRELNGARHEIMGVRARDEAFVRFAMMALVLIILGATVMGSAMFRSTVSANP